eukprot:TRINITY_DN10878_c0_g1_i1.p1 TRINITY_DN10878_c0_g1~~TRINITY_DN10878_c0_g1_i1.p1  ORF type:complete len:573 (+),score=76.27 TRINITY_DN10878_c0_g1_i1:75-1793(+)
MTTKHVTGLTLLSLLLSVIVLAQTQRCSIDREEMPNECDPLVAFAYFIPPASYNITQDDITRQVTISTLSLSGIEDDCRIPATKFACASAYQECVYYPIDTSLPNFLVFPLPRSPCKSLCEDMVKHCKGVLPSESLPNCTAIDNSGQPQYPQKSTDYEVLDQSFMVPCNSEKNQSVGTVQDCPLPLKLKHHGEADPPCQMPCPFPYWTEGQYRATTILIDVCAPITTVCAFWLMWCWFAQKRLRVFPAHLPFFATSGSLTAGIVWIISSIVGHEKIWCVDEFTPAGSNLMCGTQAFFLQMALMISAFYWFFVALTLFLLVAMEINIDHYPWYKYFVHAIGIVAPVLIATVMFAVENYSGGGLGWCGPSPDHHFAYSYALEYSWIILFLILNNLFVLGVIGKISWISYRSKKSEKLHWRYVGMLIFTVLFTIVFGWGCSYVIDLSVINDDIEEGLINWVKCNASLKEGCKDEFIPSFWYFYVVTLLWVLSGVWCLLSFGLRKSLHVRGWLFFREAVLRRNFKLLLTGFTEEHLSSYSMTKSQRPPSKSERHRSKSGSPGTTQSPTSTNNSSNN